MSAFLNSLWEEGTNDDLVYWIREVAKEKSVLNVKTVGSHRELFNELVRLYNLKDGDGE